MLLLDESEAGDGVPSSYSMQVSAGWRTFNPYFGPIKSGA